MKAAYVKAPFQFEIRDMEIGAPGRGQVRIDVRACGICGTDIDTAATGASDWQAVGHEIAGVVVDTGPGVTSVTPGQKVVLESGTFDRFSAVSRNGRVDLDNRGPNFWARGPMGFSETMVVPEEVVVGYDGLSFAAASLIEPMGVALDLVKTADIGLGDDVLVVGTGAIGLLALRLARVRGARRIYAAQRAGATRRIELARAFGADEVLLTDDAFPAPDAFEGGGVDRVLITAPPGLIEPSLGVTNKGGIVAFIGIEYGQGARVSFDANDFHFRKLQLRASFASPALYFPMCIDLARAGIVDLESMVSHTFALEEIERGFSIMRHERESRVKVVMVSE